jgi:ribosome-associated protein
VTKEDKEKLSHISQVIFDKKGMNILALDVRAFSTMTEYCVIAEGTVGRHVKAISNEVQNVMHDAGNILYHCDGQQDGEWIVMDYGDIVIHVLTPEMREKYDLEDLWRKAKIVDVDIIVDPQNTGLK